MGSTSGDEGARFENLVATHLLQRVHYLEDRDGYRYELRYIRDKEGREVDFVIVREGKIVELVEAKLSDEAPAPSLLYYAQRLNPSRATQIVLNTKKAHRSGSLAAVSPVVALTNIDPYA